MTYDNIYGATKRVELSTDQKRPVYIILALDVIGWISIVAAVIGAIVIANESGEGATGLQWASAISCAFGGLMFLAFAALLGTLSDISESSSGVLLELKSAAVKSHA
jgi:hypothetical protein